MGSGGGRGGWGAPAEGGGGPGGGGGGGGPPMFMGGGMTGGATESTAGCPWKGEPTGGGKMLSCLLTVPKSPQACVTMATILINNTIC